MCPEGHILKIFHACVFSCTSISFHKRQACLFLFTQRYLRREYVSVCYDCLIAFVASFLLFGCTIIKSRFFFFFGNSFFFFCTGIFFWLHFVLLPQFFWLFLFCPCVICGSLSLLVTVVTAQSSFTFAVCDSFDQTLFSTCIRRLLRI